MTIEDYKERRRRNLIAKELHDERDGKYRIRVVPEKGRNKVKLRPVDILNMDPEDLEELE